MIVRDTVRIWGSVDNPGMVHVHVTQDIPKDHVDLLTIEQTQRWIQMLQEGINRARRNERRRQEEIAIDEIERERNG